MQHGVGVMRALKATLYVGKIQGQDQVGDATVPAHSSEDSAKAAVFSARMTGFDHQASYDNRMVQNVTLYSVLCIGALAIRKEAGKSTKTTENTRMKWRKYTARYLAGHSDSRELLCLALLG